MGTQTPSCWTSLTSSFSPQYYVLSMIPYGLQYPFSPLESKAKWKHPLIINTISSVNLKQRPIPATMQKIYSASTKTSSQAQRCFSYCWACTASRSFLHLILSLQQEGWGCTMTWEGTQGEGWLLLTQGIFHTALCSSVKARGRRRKGETSGIKNFSSKGTITKDGVLLTWWVGFAQPGFW